MEGKTIKEVREMTDEEMESEHWHGNRKPTVLVLDDGTKIFASRDPEGNGAGAMFGERPDGEKIRVSPDD